jgi:Ras GTPase-activating-like protein IQGAP2/3
MLFRRTVGDLLEQLDNTEDSIVAFQTAARANLVRTRFAEKQRFYRENMDKVIKVQSYIRAKLQGEAYKSLTKGKNPPVGTVKGFVHLLNDSDFDFDEEIGKTPCLEAPQFSLAELTGRRTEFERLRKSVVQHVRQNELAEQYIDQLDIKIALLVKNKITLDEVVKHQRHFGGHFGSLLTNTEMASKDPFDLKALNKNSRRKLEHYQQLFFILQTQPQYLARLFRRLREQAIAEKDCRRIEHLMLGLFGYAQKRREEYYLLKLIVRAIKEEADGCASLPDYLRSTFFWSRLFGGYVRSPRDRKFLRDVLGPLVREHAVDNPELDLDSDPQRLYRAALHNEELRTGRRSARPPDVTAEEAIKDPETRQIFTDHLQDLRDIAAQLLAALGEQLAKMPFGVRYVAQQMFASLAARFPREPRPHLLQLVAHWLWRSYLQPALTQPETWGVVDRGLTPLQKRNLAEVAKVVSQVVSGRLFGSDNVLLQPLNIYVAEAIASAAPMWETC